MNIAYAAPVVYPFVKGGVEKRIHEVSRRLVEEGHEVTIYSRHWWDGPELRTYNGINLEAVGPQTELYAKGDRRSVASAISLAGRMVKPLTQGDHDIIVTPVAPYFQVFAARLATVLRRTPLVVTWHEVWGDYWYRYMGRSGVFGKTIEWTTSRLPQNAVAPSRMTAKKLKDLSPCQKVKVIPNGIDVEAINSTSPATDGYDVLYAGRLIEDKNVGLLIDAFERCDIEVRLGIIGDGPEAESLSDQARRSDAADRIDFLGFLEEYDDVIAHMRSAEVFVSPSAREGFGITLLEAMAADCTVITVEHEYSAGSEVVDTAGFVVEPTIEAVSDALERAIKGERPKTPPLERAADYDWDVVTAETEAYYRSVIEDYTGFV